MDNIVAGQTKTHYEEHLAEHYGWMLGGLENRIEEQKELFLSLGIKADTAEKAIDLGAGNGVQSIALAELGLSVTAIDFSKKLLTELSQTAKGLPVEVIESDILAFENYSHLQAGLIVCMGDTLTHLDSLESVSELLYNAAQQLCKGGKLIISFRDMTVELKDENRFIPVRSDENTVFTCFLEFFPQYVKVFDIITKKENDGWRHRISSYNKLRLSVETVAQILHEAGLNMITKDTFNRMQLIVAQK